MKNKKNIITFILLIIAISSVFFYIWYKKITTNVQPLPKYPIENKERLVYEMNETETIRYLMTQIYNSDKFVSDETNQLLNAWNEIIKNRLFWKPTDQELTTNPNWVETLTISHLENNTPMGYFIASPMLFHNYEEQGNAYSIMFAQTATNGYNHVSGSDIGAGIFKNENNIWNPVFISKNINEGFGASGEAGTLSPFLIGKNKYAYKNELTNMAQGAIFYHTNLYYFDGIKFNDILGFVAYGSDGTDCINKLGEDTESGETVDIKSKQIDNSDFYDLILEWDGTKPEGPDGECKVVPIEKKIEKYHWNGKKYELLK